MPTLTDIDAQLRAMDAAGVAMTVLSAPGSLLSGPGQPLDRTLMCRINDRLAELTTRHSGRLMAFGTVDPFDGDYAAAEAGRVVRDLGLAGICIDATRGDLWLDHPRARPTLATAVSLAIPVFVHPAPCRDLAVRFGRLRQRGELLARGTDSSASLLALMATGLLDDGSALQLIVPMISAGALLFAGQPEPLTGGRPTTLREQRRKLYLDSMGLDAPMISYLVGLLGPDHVLVGSDWPITAADPVSPPRVEAVLTEAGLAAEQRSMVMHENALRLLSRAPMRRRSASDVTT
jgi:aminocarboxymuconate-semialdehyde decarboxylase